MAVKGEPGAPAGAGQARVPVCDSHVSVGPRCPAGTVAAEERVRSLPVISTGNPAQEASNATETQTLFFLLAFAFKMHRMRLQAPCLSISGVFSVT